MLEDFGYWGLSSTVWELEDGRSRATACEVGLTLDKNEYVNQDVKPTMRGDEEIVGLHMLSTSAVSKSTEPLRGRLCSRPSR